MSNDILLSICIPTYNRPENFKVILSQLLPQMTDECEIIVRDDSDNDLSKRVFETSLMRSGINNSYYHGAKIGLDLANIFLLEKAKGRFIWWFSDDDELMDGAIAHVLRVINKDKNLTLIWVNFLSAFSGKLAVENKKEGYFRDNGEFFDSTGPSLGLVSCSILNRERGLPFKELAESRSIGFSFAILVTIFGAISKNDNIYFLEGPYITNHPTSMEIVEKESKLREIEKGSMGFEVYAINFPDTLRIFEENLDKTSIRRLIARNFSHFWKGFVIGIAKGYDTVRGKRIELIRRYWWHPEFFPAFFLMHVPKFSLSIMYKIYRTIKVKLVQG